MNIFLETYKSLTGGERTVVNMLVFTIVLCLFILIFLFLYYVSSGRPVTVNGVNINEITEKKDTIKHAAITEKSTHSTDKSYISIPKREAMNQKNINYGTNNGHIGDVTITATPPPQLTENLKQQILNRLEELGLQLPQEKRKSIFLVTANGKPSQTVSI